MVGPPERLGKLVEEVLAARRQSGPCAFPNRGLRDLAAETGTDARNEDDLSLEDSH